MAEAWELARRDGLGAISLRDLAERVDLRQPSLYAYFDSKLGLYDAMFADGNRQLLDYVSRVPPGDSPRESLAEFATAMVRFSTEDITRHQLMFHRTIPGFEPSPESYALAEEFFAIAQQRLHEAGVSGSADVDLFTALVAGLADQQVANDPGGDRWVRLAPRAIEMFLADVDRQKRNKRRAKP